MSKAVKGKVVRRIVKTEAPITGNSLINNIYSILHYFDRVSGRSAERELLNEQKKQMPLYALRETLRKVLQEESDSIKDFDNIHVYHIDRKYKPILNMINEDNFIKNARFFVLETNENLKYYDDVILVGIQKVDYDI